MEYNRFHLLSLDQSNYYHHLILQKPVGRTSIPLQRYLATTAEQANIHSVPRKIEDLFIHL
jgi:hypothetical protein